MFQQKYKNVQESPKWRVFFNLKENVNILEIDDNSKRSFGQLFRCLQPSTPSFEIQVRGCEFVQIGLAPKDHPIEKPLGWNEESIGYDIYGELFHDAKYETVRDIGICDVWNHNEIIECGIKFPRNFINDGKKSVVVYMSENKKIIKETLVKMPSDGLYPSIRILGRHVKVRLSM